MAAQMAELPRTSSPSAAFPSGTSGGSWGRLKQPSLMKTLMKERDDLKRAMDVLQSVPLFSELTSTQLERLANSLRRREVKTCPDGKFAADDENFPEGVVIHQGDVGSGAQAMYVVESGHLQACVDVVRSVSNPDGVVKEYTAGDFFGELAIVTDQPRSATVRCVETTVLLELERKDVLELLPGQLSNLISAHRRQTAMQVLKKVPMFSDLSQTKIEELAHNLHRKEIHTDENGNFSSTDPEFPNGVVIRQGELGDTMFVVESGRLQACVELVKSPSNPDGVVKEYGANEFFGELAMSSDEPRSATVRCTDDTVLLVLSKNDLPSEVLGKVDDKRLSYGVSTTMLSFGGPEEHCCMAPGLIIHPDFWFCRYKDIVMTLLILYSCSWEPFKAAFAEGDELNNISDYFVDGLYCADILINFVTGFRTHNDVELNPKVIAMTYVKSWFIVDVAATFPWDILAAGATGVDESQDMGDAESGAGVGQLALLRLLRLIRILRILRMGRIVERLSNHFKIRAAFIKIVQLVAGLMIIIHLVACLFFMLSYLSADDPITFDGYTPTECEEGVPTDADGFEILDPDGNATPVAGTMRNTWVCAKGAGRDQGKTTTEIYLLAVYFSITTVSTIGYGDISPHLDNPTEMAFTVAVEFLGMFIFSYTVSNLAELVGNMNVKNKEFHEKVDRYLEWMRDKNTPTNLRDRVLSYINTCEGSEFIYTEDDEVMMQTLSAPLQVEMKQMVFHTVLKKAFSRIKAFEMNDALLSEFTEDLAVCVRSCIAMQNDLIVHRGETAAHEMFIVLRGKVKLIGNDLGMTREIMAESPYPFFGLAEVLTSASDDQYEHLSVIAASDSDLARISRKDFEDMIEKFPEVHQDLKAIAQANLDEVASMDRNVTKKALQKVFEEACSKGSMSTGVDARKLNKRQFVEMLGSDVLRVELSEPMLSRAMDEMDPVTRNPGPTTPRVDFGNFHRWWTTRNYADPIGFKAMFEPETDKRTGETRLVKRPSSFRTSLHFAERELQRGEGGDHTPEDTDVVQFPPTEAIGAFSSDRPGSPVGSPKGGDISAMVDDLDVVRRETISIARTVQELSGSVDGIQQRMQSMEAQMAERFSSLEAILSAGRGVSSDTRTRSGAEETDSLLPGDGGRP